MKDKFLKLKSDAELAVYLTEMVLLPSGKKDMLVLEATYYLMKWVAVPSWSVDKAVSASYLFRALKPFKSKYLNSVRAEMRRRLKLK